MEIIYEGYGPHGIAVVVECATDNPTRTVANVRMFQKVWGSLGTTGSIAFIFERKGLFKAPKSAVADLENLELELIDAGLDDFPTTMIRSISSHLFRNMALCKKLLKKEILRLQQQRSNIFPLIIRNIRRAEKEVSELIEVLEEDDDVQSVYHNMQQ